MIRRNLLPLLLLLLLVSCAVGQRQPPPEISPAANGAATARQCRDGFPAGRWQFVHAITFHLAAGADGTAIGVLDLDKGEIRCVLMTVEGLTLFAARSAQDRPVVVSRAVPPFDNRGFADGLMADVRSIFLSPPGKADCGRLAGGAPVCRYLAAGRITDILPQKDGCWTMHTYSGGIGVRTIRARSCATVDQAIIPKDIDLATSGPAGYTLNLHLIRAEKLTTVK